MTTVASVFVGCKVSQADGEQALGELVDAGLEAVERHDTAEVVVVHTCCVTAEAERKSRRLVSRFSRQGRRVIVAGCAARLHPQQFTGAGVEVAAEPDWRRLAASNGDAAGADAAVGASAGGDLSAADAAAGSSAGGESNAGAGERLGGDAVTRAPVGGLGTGAAGGEQSGAHGAVTDSPSIGAADAAGRTRFVLKVQDGCAGHCSYCAVRLVRGAPRSVALDDALAAAARAIARGCGEIVVSGIDVGAWSDRERRLPILLRALVDLPGLRRLRLSSLEPLNLDSELLAAMAHPAVARHLHVPLQAADDRVLRAMARPYTLADYLARVTRAKEMLGDGLMLSTDLIVGYPSEDEAAFGRTLALIESGLFGRLHVFGFSPRPGTAAAALPPLPAATVKDRVARAMAAAEDAARAARRAALGRSAEVLLEGRRDGYWRGYSSTYIPYYLSAASTAADDSGTAPLPAAAPRAGELVTVIGRREYGSGLWGTLKEAQA